MRRRRSDAWEPVAADARLLLYGPKTRVQRIGGFIMGLFSLFVGVLGFGTLLALPRFHSEIAEGPGAAVIVIVGAFALFLIASFFSVVGWRLIRACVRSNA